MKDNELVLPGVGEKVMEERIARDRARHAAQEKEDISHVQSLSAILLMDYLGSRSSLIHVGFGSDVKLLREGSPEELLELDAILDKHYWHYARQTIMTFPDFMTSFTLIMCVICLVLIVNSFMMWVGLVQSLVSVFFLDAFMLLIFPVALIIWFYRKMTGSRYYVACQALRAKLGKDYAEQVLRGAKVNDLQDCYFWWQGYHDFI